MRAPETLLLIGKQHVCEVHACFIIFVESALKVCVMRNTEVVREHDCQLFICRVCIDRNSQDETSGDEELPPLQGAI